MRMKQLQLPGRSGFSSQPYRYAYQGQFAERNSVTQNLDFMLRSYDPRIGRWTTTDPLITGFSAYEAMGNNPVVYVDPLGADEDGPPKYGTDSGPAYRKKGKAPKDGMINLTVLMYYHPGSMVDCGVYGMEVSSGGSSGGGGGGLVPSESVAPNKVRIYGKNLGRNKNLSVTSANKKLNNPKFGNRYAKPREGSGMLPEVVIREKRTFWNMFRGFIFRLDIRLYMHRYEEYNDGIANADKLKQGGKFTDQKNGNGTTNNGRWFNMDDDDDRPTTNGVAGKDERTGLGERLPLESKLKNIIESSIIAPEDMFIDGIFVKKGHPLILDSTEIGVVKEGERIYFYKPQ